MTIDTYADYLTCRGPACHGVMSKALGRSIAVPCMATLLVRRELVKANVYNPNSVPPDKMQLLRQSIVDNGFCFPVVVIADDEAECFVVIDGFHRTVIAGPDWLDLEHIPVVVLDHSMVKRMAATVQFNKARGFHQVDLDAELIQALVGQGLDDDDIATRLGIDLDTVHRYKQVSGVASLFANTAYSPAWEMVDDE